MAERQRQLSHLEVETEDEKENICLNNDKTEMRSLQINGVFLLLTFLSRLLVRNAVADG